MKLEQVRQRVVEEELQSHREWRRRDLLPALGCIVCAGLLLWMVTHPPAEWAKGEWFHPGGWLHDFFGFAGAVLAVRAASVLALLASVYWFGSAVYALSAAGADRRRAKIAAEQPRFRQSSEER